jgi:hypothetical protein
MRLRRRASGAGKGHVSKYVRWTPPGPETSEDFSLVEEHGDVSEPSGRPDGTYAMEVLTTSGRVASLSFRIRRDFVEIWHEARCAGIFDKDALRSWLTEPGEPFMADEVMFSVDRNVDREGRVAVSLPNVRAWTLAPVALDVLRARM